MRDIRQILRAIGASFERDEIRDCRNPHTSTNLYGVQVDGDSANDTVRNMCVSEPVDELLDEQDARVANLAATFEL